MKKLRLFLCALTLSVSLFTLIGCEQRLNAENYNYSATFTKINETIDFPNSTIPLKVDLKGTAALNDEYTIKFSEQSTCKGSLKYQNNELINGVSFKYKFTQPLMLYFSPTEKGEHKIILTLESANGKKEIQQVITVYPIVFDFQLKEKSDTITLGVANIMYLNIKENLEALKELSKSSKVTKSGGGKYTLSATMIKGSGNLVVNEKTIFSLAPVTKGSETKVELLSEKDIKMVFTSTTAAKNNILFRIEDAYGNKVDKMVDFDVQNPEVNISHVFITKEYLYKTPIFFTLGITNSLQTSAFSEFSINNSQPIPGIIKVNNQTYSWQMNKQDIRTGIHNIEFTPYAIGSSVLNFKVVDNLAQETTYKIDIEIKPYPLVTRVENISSNEVDRLTPSTFDLILSEDKLEANTKFKLCFEQLQGKGVLLINGTTPINSGDKNQIEVVAGKYSFSYIPTEPGANEIKLIATDIFNQVQARTLQFNVKNNPIVATMPAIVDCYLGGSADITLKLDQISYSNNFKVQYAELVNDSSTDVLKYNNVDFNRGVDAAQHLPKGEHKFTFTAGGRSTAVRTIKFLVSDIYGQEKVVTCNVNVKHKPMTLSLTAPNEVFVGNSTDVSLSIDQIESAGNYTVKYAQLINGSANDKLSYKTANWTVNSSLNLAKGAHTFQFAPKDNANTRTIKLTIVDENGQQKEVSCDIKVKLKPMTLTAAYATGTIFVHRPKALNINVGGLFPIKIRYSGGNGSIKRNGAVVAQNTDVQLMSNEVWEFTPSGAGTQNLSFSATGADGQTKTATANGIATESEISVSLNENNHSTIINTPVSSSFNVSNTANDGSFIIEYNDLKGGRLNIASGAAVNKGNVTLQYTPNETPGRKDLVLTFKDSFGKSKSVTWTVNSTYAPITAAINATNAYIEHPVTVSYSVSKEQYSGSYYVTATSNGGGLNTTDTHASGNFTFTYTPNSVNDNKITLRIKDDQGGDVTKNANVIISLPELKYTTSISSSNIGIGFKEETTIWEISTTNYINTTFEVSLEQNIQSSFGAADITLTKIRNGVYETKGRASGLNEAAQWMGKLTITDNYGQVKDVIISISCDSYSSGGSGGGLNPIL